MLSIPLRRWRLAAALVAVTAAGCSPALDWRLVRPDAADLEVLLPCRPSTYERRVRLAGVEVALGLSACTADGQTWALAHADMVDPALVAHALDELRRASLSNVGAGATRALPLAVPGATPQASAGRYGFSGRRPDGQPLEEQVAVFARGTRVYQATVLGDRLDEDAVDTFFGSLRAPAP
ncbi:MAG: hypothetical protein MUF03_11135 [Rubrivivax sp.]|jgi:hypothetical protein|nr:hypothetical protein [Rubrivivax sp.]